MDKRLEAIIDNYDRMKIGLDDTFSFGCKMCGHCCINREDILLPPYDLYRMAKALGISVEQTVKQYCEIYIGGDSRFPIIRLKPVGKNRRCPLLKDNRCRVHQAKPTVCALYPIGRAVKLSKGELPESENTRAEYILQDVDCGIRKETHTVREWLQSFGIPADDKAFQLWQSTLIRACTVFRKAEHQVKDSVMLSAWNATVHILYINYDMDTAFLPQLKKNIKEFTELLSLLEQCCREDDSRSEKK